MVREQGEQRTGQLTHKGDWKGSHNGQLRHTHYMIEHFVLHIWSYNERHRTGREPYPHRCLRPLTPWLRLAERMRVSLLLDSYKGLLHDISVYIPFCPPLSYFFSTFCLWGSMSTPLVPHTDLLFLLKDYVHHSWKVYSIVFKSNHAHNSSIVIKGELRRIHTSQCVNRCWGVPLHMLKKRAGWILIVVSPDLCLPLSVKASGIRLPLLLLSTN